MRIGPGPTPWSQVLLLLMLVAGFALIEAGPALQLDPLLLIAFALLSMGAAITWAVQRRPSEPRWWWLMLSFLVAWATFGEWYVLAGAAGETVASNSGSTLPVDLWLGLYLSAQTLTTVSYGDVVPQGAAIRTIAMIEMATTVGLVSVGISSYFSQRGTGGAPPSSTPHSRSGTP